MRRFSAAGRETRRAKFRCTVKAVCACSRQYGVWKRGQSGGRVLNKRLREFRGAKSDKEGNGKFGLGVNRRPRTNVTDDELTAHRGRDVPFLGVDERPDFVTLHVIALEVADSPIMVGFASLAKVHKKFRHRVLGNASHAHRGAYAVAFHQGRYHLDLLLTR